jgi:hypothetical protein
MTREDVMTAPTRIARIGVFLVLALVAGTADLAAQSDDEFEKVFPYIGNWETEVSSPDGQDRGNCGGRVGDFGEKIVNCTLPVDPLPLNARAEAWLKYMDILQSPSWAECVPIGLPTMLSEGSFISASPGRITMTHSAITRTIWMNGIGPKPGPGELHQHGYSTGRFDGNDLIVETTNFVFDPDGIDDHIHMASSVRKKVTERWQIIDENNVRLFITLEDPTFLTRPFTYAVLQTKKPGGPAAAWRACDPDVGRREIEFAYPGNKYSDTKSK